MIKKMELVEEFLDRITTELEFLLIMIRDKGE
jgi:hypothetical protein